MTVALPTDKAVADLAIRNEYKRQICELIDDALSVDATVQPVLRACAGSIKNQYADREPEPGHLVLSMEIATNVVRPNYRRIGGDCYEFIGFEKNE